MALLETNLMCAPGSPYRPRASSAQRVRRAASPEASLATPWPSRSCRAAACASPWATGRACRAVFPEARATSECLIASAPPTREPVVPSNSCLADSCASAVRLVTLPSRGGDCGAEGADRRCAGGSQTAITGDDRHIGGPARHLAIARWGLRGGVSGSDPCEQFPRLLLSVAPGIGCRGGADMNDECRSGEGQRVFEELGNVQ